MTPNAQLAVPFTGLVYFLDLRIFVTSVVGAVEQVSSFHTPISCSEDPAVRGLLRPLRRCGLRRVKGLMPNFDNPASVSGAL